MKRAVPGLWYVDIQQNRAKIRPMLANPRVVGTVEAAETQTASEAHPLTRDQSVPKLFEQMVTIDFTTVTAL
ncbi:hypothetical protein WJX73_007195 [Symbiochloris irregularis]|uniref:Uncharacterized protein n=1 Tax=Symbiochloris irregularis TaxID=706552 RepID=A0AAW1PN78_9CHLO